MSEKDYLFFELIRVAIGTQYCLSRKPKVSEWDELYSVAKKHSLIGVCFAALQRLGADADEGFSRMGLSEMQYLTWMGMSAYIQQRNEVVNRQCVILQTKLAAEGFRSCVLKGQGVAALYNSRFSCIDYNLSLLRQSGDIDLWVDASKNKVVEWAEKVGVTETAGYLHVGASCFDETEVELHYRPTYIRSLRHNRRLQKFCDGHKNDWQQRNGLIVPSWEFDVVYQLSHIYRHLFGLGIGLRQLMDYYWLLCNSPSNDDDFIPFEIVDTLKYLGLNNFASAVMYVMREVFDMDEKYLLCPVDEKRGRMLLEMVMQTGNFGKSDKKQKDARKTTMGGFLYKLQQWWQLMRLYPEETLSAPLWTLIRKMEMKKVICNDE